MKEHGLGDDDTIKEIISEVDSDNVSHFQDWISCILQDKIG